MKAAERRPADTRDDPTTTPDVLIVGAGQAGLAVAHGLRSSGLTVVLVDVHARIGDSWRERYDSLTLFTPRSYSALPGLPLSGPEDGYPTKDEMADYLELYAATFGLTVRVGLAVTDLSVTDGVFVAALSDGAAITARSVVIATGGFAEQRVPSLATSFGPDVVQLASSEYRSPADVPNGPILVVGDGAAGRQIAKELARSRAVLLAVGDQKHPVVRDRLLGRSLFWWLDHLRILNAPRTSRIGRWMMAKDSIPRPDLALRLLAQDGVTLRPRLIAANGSRATFQNGESAAVDAVIWATGYRNATAWVHVPGALDANADYIHVRGVTPIERLFVIGQPWQHSRGSATIGGVGRDAAFIVQRIRAALAPARRPARRPLTSIADRARGRWSARAAPSASD